MQQLCEVPAGGKEDEMMVIKATLRSPYGNQIDYYIDPAGKPVRRGVKVAFSGARDLWSVLAIDVPVKLPKGHDYWTVTKVVE